MQECPSLKLMGNVAAFWRCRWVTLSWEISILLPWASQRHQRWVRTIFPFALALKCHGNCHKYLCRTNISAPRCSLLPCRSQRHKGRWRFVTLMQPAFTPLCPGPQTSTTAEGAELGKKPALSSGTLVLRSPTCENLGATAHFKRHSPQPPQLLYTHAHVFAHSLTKHSQTHSRAQTGFISHRNSFLLSKYRLECIIKCMMCNPLTILLQRICRSLWWICVDYGPNNFMHKLKPNVDLPSRSSGLVRSITLWPIFPSSPSLPRWCPMLSKCALSCREIQTVRYTICKK